MNDTEREIIKAAVSAFIVCVFVFFAMLLGGCASTKVGYTDIVGGNSRTAGQLETTVKALDGATSSSRERVGKLIETSRRIEDGIDRLEYLFDGYEREVERLQSEIDDIRKKIDIQSEVDSGRSGNFDTGNNNTDFSGCIES